MTFIMVRSLARCSAPLALAALAVAQGEIYHLPVGNEGGPLAVRVAGVGDLDGDEVPDVAAAGVVETDSDLLGRIRIWSGKTGALLLEIDGSAGPLPSDGYTGLGPVGDVNGDGIQDIWAANYLKTSSTTGKEWAGAVWIHSGADGSVQYYYEGSNDSEFVGYRVAGGADLNGDSLADFAIGVPGRQRKVEPLGTMIVGASTFAQVSTGESSIG